MPKNNCLYQAEDSCCRSFPGKTELNIFKKKLNADMLYNIQMRPDGVLIMAV
jgi:hypothetical protein